MVVRREHRSSEHRELALNGGTPVRSTPIPVTPRPTDADIRAATSVLRSGVLGGPEHSETGKFEELLTASSGVTDAVAVNSGTAALHCAFQALDLGPGDEVIVPAHTFIATATPVLMTGATPVVVDVDATTFCLDPEAVRAALTSRTKAITAVHINGHPAPVDLLPADVPIVSDACQAHGAELFGTPVTALGVISALSFWQDKLITAGGEGGAVLTSDRDLARTVRLIRSHAQQPIPGTTHSHHVALGHNYRITGAQAAMGHSQLARLPEILTQRAGNAATLAGMLGFFPGISVPVTRDGAKHAFWRFVIALGVDQFTVHTSTIIEALRAEGIPAAPRYPIPLSKQPVLVNRGRITPCPVAESLSDRLVMLPLPPLTENSGDLADIAEAVRKVISAYGC